MILICHNCLLIFGHKANKPTNYCPEKVCQEAKKKNHSEKVKQYQRAKAHEYKKLENLPTIKKIKTKKRKEKELTQKNGHQVQYKKDLTDS